jgi:hypothetical protein
MSKYSEKREQRQLSKEINAQLNDFVEPLLNRLDAQIDKRLVRTFYKLLQVIVQFRHPRNGLLLSELGAYILDPEHAPAGTKRISNLIRSTKWGYEIIETYLWEKANQHIEEVASTEGEVLVAWDESVLEKPESIAIEGLCAVRSSKARRLKRIKPGYYNPPSGRPIYVPGMNWVALMVMGMQSLPSIAAMRWWSTRGKFTSDKRTEELKLLKHCVEAWGERVLHVWDRGFAGGPWLSHVNLHKVRFVMRWQKNYKLIDRHGVKRKAWEITRGKRSWQHKELWDNRRHCYRKTGVYACPVSHPEYDGQLWLVLSRPGKGRSPWYLLTNQPVSSVDDAWHFIFAYARRWQVEMAFRFSKTDLSMESPRLWRWDNRLKLLLIVTLVHAFLLSLLSPSLLALRYRLLRLFCHRTGKRYRTASVPLYRLRSALSRLWLAYPPPSLSNSG